MTNKLKYYTLLTCFVIILILLGFQYPKEDYQIKTQKKRLDYSGSNGLFIEYGDSIQFNWITSNKDIGYYELRDFDNTIISKGETVLNNVHSVKIKHNIDKSVVFKFGAINENLFQIKLRPKEELSNAIFEIVDSLYVVGDVHGRYDQLVNLLQKSNIIDSNLEWISGKSNLVFLGDVFDRGDDVTKVLWFIYELEEKARLKGGKVHLVLGNHEIMVMSKDLRYLSIKERSIPIAYATTYDYLFHPINSFLGSWLTSKPSIIKIDKVIFAHGGIIDLKTKSIDEFNKKAASYIKNPMFLDIINESPDSLKYDLTDWNELKYFFYEENSPYWYRGYVYYDTLAPQLNAMLRKYNSKVHVVAHTPLETVTERYKGKLLTTDLNDAATQLLLMIRKKNKYDNYKIDSSGKVSKLN